MSELNVRIVKLEPMQVVSFLGFGESPEELAWGKLLPLGNRKRTVGGSRKTSAVWIQ